VARRQGSPATRIHTHSGHPHARALPPASLTLPDVKHVRSRAQDREESCTTTGSKAQPVSPMDYNPGGGGNFHMMCEYCGTVAEYSADDADDGLFSCPRCYAVHTHTSTQAAATNHADVPAATSGDLAGARDKRRRVGGAGGLGGAGVGAPGDDDPALAAAAAGGADGAAPAKRARVRRRRRRRWTTVLNAMWARAVQQAVAPSRSRATTPRGERRVLHRHRLSSARLRIGV
jgi:hypothetical protein